VVKLLTGGHQHNWNQMQVSLSEEKQCCRCLFHYETVKKKSRIFKGLRAAKLKKIRKWRLGAEIAISNLKKSHYYK
jgi:hypothetical protein